MKIVAKIKSIKTEQDFMNHLALQEPFIMEGFSNGYRAVELWNDAYFKEKIGKEKVSYFQSKTSCFPDFDESNVSAQ